MDHVNKSTVDQLKSVYVIANASSFVNCTHSFKSIQSTRKVQFTVKWANLESYCFLYDITYWKQFCLECLLEYRKDIQCEMVFI